MCFRDERDLSRVKTCALVLADFRTGVEECLRGERERTYTVVRQYSLKRSLIRVVAALAKSEISRVLKQAFIHEMKGMSSRAGIDEIIGALN